MSGLILACSLTLLGAMDVWVESPLTRVWPETVGKGDVHRSARLYAAIGERESFQLCIRARGEDIKGVVVSGGEVEGVGAPKMRRVGYLQLDKSSVRAAGEQKITPDPLLDLEPIDLGADQTASVWVTYSAPQGATPGTHTGKLTVKGGKGQKRDINVKLTVFNFSIPDVSSLRGLFRLDRESVTSAYTFGDRDLEKWKPFYDVFGGNRFSYSVWDGSDLVKVEGDGAPDTGAFREHLDYAATQAKMNVLDLSGGDAGVLLFPEKAGGAGQDALQNYLIDMVKWLQEKGRAEHAVVEPMRIPERSRWTLARDQCFRVKRDYPKIDRLLAGAMHPYFELSAEVWAAPLRDYDLHAVERLRTGLSLVDPQPYPAAKITASSSGRIDGSFAYQTTPEEGYDACVFTYWVSANVPTLDKTEWFEVAFKEPVNVTRVKVIWKTGFEAVSPDIILNSSAGDSTLKWKENRPSGPYMQSWAEGEWPDGMTFSMMRLAFNRTVNGGPVGIVDILLNDPPPQPSERISPVEPWLLLYDTDFPSFAADVHPVEARMVPWVCYGHTLAGFLCRSMNLWPEDWAANIAGQPLVWPVGQNGADFLFYPGRTGPLPSIRSESLRDGLEDYEYLVALQRAVAEKKVTQKETAELGAKRFYGVEPDQKQLDEYRSMVLKGHNAIGNALSQLAEKGKL